MARVRRPVAGALIALGAVGAAAAVALVVTPRDHAVSGCLWWTARQVGDLHAGDRGCLRAYVVPGGLAESTAGDAPIVAYDPGHGCPWTPGEAVVARMHAISDDGRLIVLVDACR